MPPKESPAVLEARSHRDAALRILIGSGWPARRAVARLNALARSILSGRAR